jgi:hypothetical protein
MGRCKASKVDQSEMKKTENFQIAKSAKIRNSAVQNGNLCFLSLPRQVGQIARVDPDPDGAIAEIVESHRNGTKVQRSAPAISDLILFSLKSIQGTHY